MLIMKITGRIIFTTFRCPHDTIIRSKYNVQQITRILMFKFNVVNMILPVIFIIKSITLSCLFSCCCLYLGGNKFSIKFAGKMFKPTSSSISSMVGALWTINFYIFFALT